MWVLTFSYFRSLFGFVFPLFSGQMFTTLGIGPGNTLLAGLFLTQYLGLLLTADIGLAVILGIP
jgi:hypothetical protein